MECNFIRKIGIGKLGNSPVQLLQKRNLHKMVKTYNISVINKNYLM